MKYWNLNETWRIVESGDSWEWEFLHEGSYVPMVVKAGKERMLVKFIMKHVPPTGALEMQANE